MLQIFILIAYKLLYNFLLLPTIRPNLRQLCLQIILSVIQTLATLLKCLLRLTDINFGSNSGFIQLIGMLVNILLLKVVICTSNLPFRIRFQVLLCLMPRLRHLCLLPRTMKNDCLNGWFRFRRSLMLWFFNLLIVMEIWYGLIWYLLIYVYHVRSLLYLVVGLITKYYFYGRSHAPNSHYA